jgi:nitrite reductase/ring-hydroxylating ferredoxin subunit
MRPSNTTESVSLPSDELVQLSRRNFMSVATLSVCGLALSGCASSEGNSGGPTTPTPQPPVDAVVVTATEVRITVARVPELQNANGFVFVSAPRVIVANLGSNSFRAYSAVCPHENQNVSQVQNGLLFCPTHGSRFDLATGQVVNGPANRGLTTRASTFDAATGVLTVRLS